MSRSRFFSSVLIALAALSLPACGGGGGGGGDGGGGVPGPLLALAITGDPAPGGLNEVYNGPVTGGSNLPVMDVAPNGFAAFEMRVMPANPLRTAGVVENRAIFAAEPDGTVTRVFTTGEAAPDRPNSEEIAQFNRVWVCDDGTVIAHVTTEDGGSKDALIAATISGGVRTDTTGILYEGASPLGVSGPIKGIESDARLGVGACRLFVILIDSNDDRVLYVIDADGSDGQALLTEGGTGVGGASVESIDGFGISENGERGAVMVDTTADPGGQELWRWLGGASGCRYAPWKPICSQTRRRGLPVSITSRSLQGLWTYETWWQ